MLPIAVFSLTDVQLPQLNHYQLISAKCNQQYDELLAFLARERPVAIVSIAAPSDCALFKLPFEWRKKWIDVPDAAHITHEAIDHCYFGSLKHGASKDWPLVSAISSTWCSGERLLRPWRSLRSQTYTNWEWIIWDDSPESDHGATYAAALKLADQDPRVKVFKAPRPSGLIGQMKRLACGSATGAILMELDHDDDLMPEALQWLVDAAKARPECQFFYSDTMEVFEDNYEPRAYPDGFAFGHGSQMNFWHEGTACQESTRRKGSWQVHMSVAPINDLTVTHLVGLPNHFRAWRRDFYWAIGGHNDLSVADDYDLLVRSLKSKAPVDASNWCHIRAPAYIQYFSRTGQTFTFKRNALIQHSNNWLRHEHGLGPMPSNTIPVWCIEGSDLTRSGAAVSPIRVPKSLVILGRDQTDGAERVGNALARGPVAVIQLGHSASPGQPIGPLKSVLDTIADYSKITWWCLQAGPADARRYVELFYGTAIPEYRDESNA